METLHQMRLKFITVNIELDALSALRTSVKVVMLSPIMLAFRIARHSEFLMKLQAADFAILS